MAKNALGKGLGALLHENTTFSESKKLQSLSENSPNANLKLPENITVEEDGSLWVDPALLIPNPKQPRLEFDQKKLDELCDSIKVNGILQPIIIEDSGNGNFYIIAGERRLKATKLAGISTIPAVIVEVTTKDSAVLALIENLQRENLNFLEESQAYEAIMKDYGYTQQELANTLGKSQSTIANKLRILKLPAKVQDLLVENNLTERHARALLKLPSEEYQVAILEKVIKQELNVKRTEQLVEQMLVDITKEEMIKHKANQKVKTYIRDMRLVTNTITEAVNLIQKAGIDAKYTMKEHADSYEIRIKIPTNK